MPATPALHFQAATLPANRAALHSLQLEYLRWVLTGMAPVYGTPVDQLQGQPLDDYVATSLDKVCAAQPPHGVFYLIHVDGALAAMGGLRPLPMDSAGTVAEIKRLFVRPAWRGQGLGQRVLERLLADAQAFGYHELCLDSAPFMSAAHQLYLAHGFSDCQPYAGCEVPPEFHLRWRFMRRLLAAPPATAAKPG